MNKLKNTRIFGSIGLIACFLGTILPYITFSFFGYDKSISLWGYWEGKVIMALIIANALFIFRDFIKKYVPQMYNSGIGKKIENANSKLVIIPTILIAAFAVYMILQLDLGSSDYLHYGVGFWILWIGIIALFAHSFMYKGLANDINTNQVQQVSNNIQEQQMQQPNQFNSQNQQMQQTQQATQFVQQPMNSIQQEQSMNNVQSQQMKKICSNCGNSVDANATFCIKCGNKM